MEYRPYLFGLGAAVVLIVCVSLVGRFSHHFGEGSRFRTIFYGLACLAFAAAIFVAPTLLWRIGFAVIAVFNLVCALGNALQWPGFRPPPPQDDEESEDDPGGVV